jgi:hypothetical protein
MKWLMVKGGPSFENLVCGKVDPGVFIVYAKQATVTLILRNFLRLKAAQHSVHPTSGSLRVFKHFSWLEVGSGKVALSQPAQPPVTQTVGLLKSNDRLKIE